MTTYQTASDASLSAKINAELTGGVSVTIDRYDGRGETVHGCVVQHGARRRIVQRSSPFSDVDIADIVAAARRWADAAQVPDERASWVDDPDDADELLLG